MLACRVHRVHRSTHKVWKARMWLAATNYFESEIINKLITHIKIHREAIKSKILEGNILIKCSLFIAFDSLSIYMLYKNFKTRNISNHSNNSLLVCSLIEFKNNYLREYNSQLSRFVVYLNRHIAASFSESFFFL